MHKSSELDNIADVRVQTYTFGEEIDHFKEEKGIELLAASHTKVEHLLYKLMLAETRIAKTTSATFSTRRLMIESGVPNYNSVRRAVAGLLKKMSIERPTDSSGNESSKFTYIVYSPSEIFARREKSKLHLNSNGTFSIEPETCKSEILIEKLIALHNLSRREAQVALKCAEGLSNSEIGEKLFIQVETVKFHLRNIFIKFAVKRRTELMARLFQEERAGLISKN